MLYRALCSVWEDQSHRNFIVQPNGATWIFARFKERVEHYASCLEFYQLVPGQRVLVQIEKSVHALALYFACLRQGLVFVPVNTACTIHELSYFVQDAEPSLLIKDPALNVAFTCSVTLVSFDVSGAGEFDRCRAPAVPAYDAQADDPAAMVYTSGTTGRSKGAVLSQRNLLSNARALVQVWDFEQDDVLLHALPIFHVHGLFIALHTAMLSGASLVFLPRFDVLEVIKSLPLATVLMGVPTYYTRLLERHELNHASAQHIRLFISGSAPLLPATFAQFEQRTGQRILERYGMSETNIICSNPVEGERLPGTVGYPLPGVTLRIADDNDQPLPANQPGAIQVQGDNVLQTYWRREDLTEQEFTDDGFFRTGDIGACSADGRVTLIGRAKDMIISGGLNVYPAEIERFLNAQSGVLESAIVGIPHPDFGEQVIAFVVPENAERLANGEAGAAMVAALHLAARLQLANYKRPKQFHLLDELPRNTMGKVQKYRLAERIG